MEDLALSILKALKESSTKKDPWKALEKRLKKITPSKKLERSIGFKVNPVRRNRRKINKIPRL